MDEREKWIEKQVAKYTGLPGQPLADNLRQLLRGAFAVADAHPVAICSVCKQTCFVTNGRSRCCDAPVAVPLRAEGGVESAAIAYVDLWIDGKAVNHPAAVMALCNLLNNQPRAEGVLAQLMAAIESAPPNSGSPGYVFIPKAVIAEARAALAHTPMEPGGGRDDRVLRDALRHSEVTGQGVANSYATLHQAIVKYLGTHAPSPMEQGDGDAVRLAAAEFAIHFYSIPMATQVADSWHKLLHALAHAPTAPKEDNDET